MPGLLHIMVLHSPVSIYVLHPIMCAILSVSWSDLQAEHLDLPSGVIWTALNIDYPGHSFSHLGIFFGWSLRL